MTLKELVRASICGEMEDISACGTDSEAFSGKPGWDKVAGFYDKLAEEKRARLLELGKIFKEGTGFRQRRIEPARSPEASLRARVMRAGEAADIYASLMKVMNKPEFKAAMRGLAEREREIFASLKELQAGFKKD